MRPSARTSEKEGNWDAVDSIGFGGEILPSGRTQSPEQQSLEQVQPMGTVGSEWMRRANAVGPVQSLHVP